MNWWLKRPKKVVTEITFPGAEHKRAWRFPTEGYTQAISFDYFFHNVKKGHKVQRCWRKDIVLYSGKWEDEHDAFWNGVEKFQKENPVPNRPYRALRPVVTDVDNIWHFYREIGYDYKRQIWLPHAYQR